MRACGDCREGRHRYHRQDGSCGVVIIDGPASDKGRKVGDGYKHVGRNETPCPCPGSEEK